MPTSECANLNFGICKKWRCTIREGLESRSDTDTHTLSKSIEMLHIFPWLCFGITPELCHELKKIRSPVSTISSHMTKEDVCMRVIRFNRFSPETNWCSYSYILYNVYQTKTNTASNLKRIQRRKKNKLKTEQSIGFWSSGCGNQEERRLTGPACRIPTPPGQQTEVCSSRRAVWGKGSVGKHKWRWDGPGFAELRLFLKFI